MIQILTKFIQIKECGSESQCSCLELHVKIIIFLTSD